MEFVDIAGECLLDRRVIREEEHLEPTMGGEEARLCCQPVPGRRLWLQAIPVALECSEQELEVREAG